MHSLTYLAATAALLTASLVAGAPVNAESSTFSVKQVPNLKMKGLKLNGAAQIAKTLRKYGATVPAHILAAAAVNGNQN
jgi:aspergillopepsin I